VEFKSIREEINCLEFEALRTDCDNYFEAVVVKSELTKLNDRLKKPSGEPAWPSKTRLSFKMEEAVNGFGGIMPGQTLYCKDGTESFLAMLWPWQDGVRTTVKIIQK
jgi:hypothetical protein